MPDNGKLVVRVAPGTAVEDEAIHPRPEFFVEGLGEIRLPPQTEWEVGVQVGKNDVW